MRMEFNAKDKKWFLDISPIDKCFACMYKPDCCLLEEIRQQRVVIINGIMYKESCSIYSYLPDEEVETYLYKDYFES